MPALKHSHRASARATCCASLLVCGLLPAAVLAQTITPAPEVEASALAIRCELRTIRAPDATQILYYYISEARRTVYETDGSPLGNVVQFSPQRIVVTRNQVVEGGIRSFVFDRMIGSLTVTSPSQAGNRETLWSMSGACQRVDAARQKF